MPRLAEPLTRIVSMQELDEMLNELSPQLDTPAKARKAEKRMTLIRMRLNGYSISECSKCLGITERTCYNIQRDWNNGKKDWLIPGTSPGANPKLDPKIVENLKVIILEKGMTVKETAEYILENENTKLSENQIRRIFHDEVKKLRNRK